MEAEKYYSDRLTATVSFDAEDYSLRDNLLCGQFFNYQVISGGRAYIVVQGERVCIAEQKGDKLCVLMESLQGVDFWRNSFAVGSRPPGLKDVMDAKGGHMRAAYEYSKGLRLLKQDPWDCLVSYIISQRNNIDRIVECVQAICGAVGVPLCNVMTESGRVYSVYAFPRPEDIVEGSLATCRLGYREKYIYGIADAVRSGQLKLDELRVGKVSSSRALQELVRYNGVGVKVASCAALYGLEHYDLFPIDVWTDRAVKLVGMSAEDTAEFGNLAGWVQLYLYHYVRHL